MKKATKKAARKDSLGFAYKGEVSIPATEKFSTAEFFHAEQGVEKSRDFFVYMVGKEEEPNGPVTVRYHDLKPAEIMPGAAVVQHFGGDRAETTMAAIWWLIQRQMHGERGVLRARAHDPCPDVGDHSRSAHNVFFVRNHKGQLTEVVVAWDGEHWEVDADNSEYVDIDRVFVKVDAA